TFGACGGGDPANRRPEINDDWLATPEDVAVQIEVLANDTDADGDPIELVSVAPVEPAEGQLVRDGDALRFTPAPDFVGELTVRYIASDHIGGDDGALI